MAEITAGGEAMAKDIEQIRERVRFEQELEFVQCLANPEYIKYLAQRLYFDDEKFVAYLRYLTYWKEPKYARFILYPSCLKVLDLVLSDPKRASMALKDPNFVEMLRVQQFYTWQNT